MARNSTARILHDVGLAAWFGGSLMGAVGLNGASREVRDPTDRARAASAGWGKWAPVNAAAIGAHLLGGARIVRVNRGRVGAQKSVAGWTIAKTVLTAAAVGATAYSGFLGRKLQQAGSVHSASGTIPSAATPPEAAGPQQQLDMLQWAIPALTGGIVVASAVMGEQQRASEVARGSAKRAAQAIGQVSSHPKAAAKATRKAVRRVDSPVTIRR